MTEKERPLPTQPDHIQNSRDTPEDEINLVELLEILFRKKTIIVVVAFICTLLSILYAKSMVPTYKATIGFLPVDKRSLAEYSNLTEAIYPKTDDTLVRPIMKYNESFLSSFFTIIKSYPTQEKVFIEKNFLKRFVDNKPSANMEKMVLGEINKSIQIKQSGNVKINSTILFIWK
jgi:LPS O-antigen subunit length determinant protein (WzzB/FepE family)